MIKQIIFTWIINLILNDFFSSPKETEGLENNKFPIKDF